LREWIKKEISSLERRTTKEIKDKTFSQNYYSKRKE